MVLSSSSPVTFVTGLSWSGGSVILLPYSLVVGEWDHLNNDDDGGDLKKKVVTGYYYFTYTYQNEITVFSVVPSSSSSPVVVGRRCRMVPSSVVLELSWWIRESNMHMHIT